MGWRSSKSSGETSQLEANLGIPLKNMDRYPLSKDLDVANQDDDSTTIEGEGASMP